MIRLIQMKKAPLGVAALVLAAMVTPPAVAKPGTDGWKTFQVPIRQGLAIQFRYPPTWKVQMVNGPKVQIRDAAGNIAFFYVAMRKPTDYWINRFKASEEETSQRYVLTRAALAKHPGYAKYYRHFTNQRATLGGFPAQFREVASLRREVSHGPQRAYWEMLYFGRIPVTASFYSREPALYRKWRPAALAMAASVRIVRADTLGPGDAGMRTYDSKTARLSYRRGYYVNARFSLILDRRWKAVVWKLTDAGKKREQGTFTLAFTPPWADPKTRASGRMVVAFSGLPIPVLRTDAFLATAPALIRKHFGEPEELSRKKINLRGMRFLARSRIRRMAATYVTYVRTYRVTAKDGTVLHVTAYTAGGLTMAANLLLVGTRPVHRRLIREAELSITTFQLVLSSSALMFGRR